MLFVPGKEPSTQWFTMAKERAPALGLYDKLPQFYFEAAFERTADAAQTLRHSSR